MSLIERVAVALEGVPHEILVMDDRSPDGTAALVREAMSAYPQTQVIERQPPAGLTLSIFDGIERARGTFVAWMDCDFSHPPELLPDLFAPLRDGDADITCASRYVPGGADNRGDRAAVFASLAITKLARWFIDRRVLDYTTGYVMAPRTLVPASKLKSSGTELVARRYQAESGPEPETASRWLVLRLSRYICWSACSSREVTS